VNDGACNWMNVLEHDAKKINVIFVKTHSQACPPLLPTRQSRSALEQHADAHEEEMYEGQAG